MITRNQRKNLQGEIKIELPPPRPRNHKASSPFVPTSYSIFGDKAYKTVIIQDTPPEVRTRIYKHYDHLEEYKHFVHCSNIVTEKVIDGPTKNSFFDALYLAYVRHGELVLSPDDVWLQINHCFCKYANKFQDKLRNKIVPYDDAFMQYKSNLTEEEKKFAILKPKHKDLVVIYDETEPNAQDLRDKGFRWDLIINKLSDILRKNTNNVLSSKLECNFSTTGPIEKVSSQISLMTIFEKYSIWNYIKVICGIQKVHFLGEEKDWIDLEKKLLKLKDYELKDEKQYVDWIE